MFLRTYISLTKSHMYLGYNVLCTEDIVYKYFVSICVRNLVNDGLDVNRLVTDSPDVSNIYY